MATVVMDARTLSDASSYRGIGTYVRSLLRGLAAESQLKVKALALPGATIPDGVEVVTIHRRAPGRLATLEHDLRLPLDLRRVAGDLFHSPALDPPRRIDRPWVQTLHDVIPLVRSDPELAAERRRWIRYRSRFASAAAVIADSRHTALDSIRTLGLDRERVHVVHLGVDAVFQPPAHRRVADPPYLLSVAEYGPHKGFAEAFEVAAGVADAGYPHVLKVAGRIAPWTEPTILRLREASRRPERVELLGFVDDLLPLYQAASATIVTSRYEGFGLPAVESMACGTPVVAFDNSATAEVVDNGGLLVVDGDVDKFVGAVRRLLDSDITWSEMSDRGLQRAKAFSWTRCVALHAEIFEAAAA